MERRGGRLSGILAMMLLICTIFQSSAFAFAADTTAPENEVPLWQTMGVKEVLAYSEDKSSALVGVDLTEVDTEQYQVQQVQGPDGLVLELGNPVITAAANGTYTFEITYTDTKDKTEQKQSTKLSVKVNGIAAKAAESADSDKPQEESKTEEKTSEEARNEKAETAKDEEAKNEETKTEEQTEVQQAEAQNGLKAERTAEVPATYTDESPKSKAGEENYFNGIRYAYVKSTEDPFMNTEKSRVGDYTKRIYWNVEGQPDKVTLEIFEDSQLIVGPVEVTGQEYYEIRAELLKGSIHFPSLTEWHKYFMYLGLNGVRATYRFTAEKGNYKQVFRGAFGYNALSNAGALTTNTVPVEPLIVNTASPAVMLEGLEKNGDFLNINWRTGGFIVGETLSGMKRKLERVSTRDDITNEGPFDGNVQSGIYIYNHGGVGEDQAPIMNPFDNKESMISTTGVPAWSPLSAKWTQGASLDLPYGTTRSMDYSLLLRQGYNTIDMGSHASYKYLYTLHTPLDTYSLATYMDHLRLTYYEGDYSVLLYNANYPKATAATSGSVPEDYTLYEQRAEPIVAGYEDLAAEGADGTIYEIVGWSRAAQEPSENPTPEFKAGENYHTQDTSGGITKNGTLYAVWKMTPPPTNEVTVKKTVAGDTVREDFVFDVKFTTEDGSVYSGAVEYTLGSETQTITGGEGSITLKNGGTFKMKIPETVYYQVTEKDYTSEGAKTTVSVDGGEKTESLTSERRKSAAATIDFTNTYPKWYDFTIQEAITGSGADMKRGFSVKASFYDKDGKEVTGFAYTGTKGATDSGGSDSGTTGTGGVTLTMPHDSAMVFKNIPEGTECKIVLDDGEDSYIYYVDGTIENDGTVTGGMQEEPDGSYKVIIGKDKTQVQTIHYKGIVVPTGRNDTKFPVLPMAAGGGMMLLILYNLLLKRSLQIGGKI